MSMDGLRECRAMLDQVSSRLLRLSAEQENITHNNNSPRPSSSATAVDPAMPVATSALQLGAHGAAATALRGSGRDQSHDQPRASQGPSPSFWEEHRNLFGFTAATAASRSHSQAGKRKPSRGEGVHVRNHRKKASHLDKELCLPGRQECHQNAKL